jgi:hypothetical protein
MNEGSLTMTIAYVTVKGTIRNGKLEIDVPPNALPGEVSIQIPVSETTAVTTGLDVESLFQALEQFREGLTEEAWAQIEHDINYEYIEPVDEPGDFVAE